MHRNCCTVLKPGNIHLPREYTSHQLKCTWQADQGEHVIWLLLSANRASWSSSRPRRCREAATAASRFTGSVGQKVAVVAVVSASLYFAPISRQGLKEKMLHPCCQSTRALPERPVEKHRSAGRPPSSSASGKKSRANNIDGFPISAAPLVEGAVHAAHPHGARSGESLGRSMHLGRVVDWPLCAPLLCDVNAQHEYTTHGYVGLMNCLTAQRLEFWAARVARFCCPSPGC